MNSHCMDHECKCEIACLDCNNLICIDCALDRKNKHYGHDLISFNKIVNSKRKCTNDKISVSKSMIKNHRARTTTKKWYVIMHDT